MVLSSTAAPPGPRRTLTFDGRLPGVDCQPALPPQEERIRMDVAAFVGFAERGPCDLPVAVEDINQYQAVFGGDLVVATDAGAPVHAYLPGAVAAFFDNGGRRCYVVRVTGAGRRSASWVVPGIILRRPDGVVEKVRVEAAWPGTWTAGHRVATTLLSEPLATADRYVRARPGQPGSLLLRRSARLQVGVGDLLRLDLSPAFPGLYVLVSEVRTAVAGDLAGGRDIVVETSTEVAFTLPDLLGSIGCPAASADAGLPGTAAELMLGPDELAALPDVLPVRAAWRLGLDLVVRREVDGRTELVERWLARGFDPGSAYPWLDVLQPSAPEGGPAPQPDRSRSMVLRADPSLVGPEAGLGDQRLDGIFLPVGTGTVPAGPGADPSGERPDAPGADGLDVFDPVAMFCDPGLISTGQADLVTTVEALTSLSAHPRQLRGLHALAVLPDVDLVAVPDVVHRPWWPAPPAPVPYEPPPERPAPPDWSDFRACAVPVPPPVPPPRTPFLNPEDRDQPPVCADPAAFDVAPLVRVQQRLAELCAARADLVAVLSVPRHFDVDAVLAWRDLLADATREEQAGRVVSTPLSYAAYWHPWMQLVEPATPELDPLRSQPTDGAAAGLVAARGLDRGVWIAPANLALRGPVALTPRLSAAETVELFDAHANVLRPLPGGIVAISAHTLTEDRLLLQLSVRRLLILIRKIALREGARYVFETNTDRFRALVRSRFERILASLADRGALAAYQVVTDSGVNTAADLDQGRLVVVLRVAPTQPTEFITITLRRSGEGLLDVAVG